MEEQNQTLAPQEPAPTPVKAKKTGLGFKDNPTRYITSVAILAALAYVVMAVGKIPVPFAVVGPTMLKFEAKDVVIVIGGYIFGPLASVITSVLVSLIEMITVSDTGIYGAIMNVVSTLAFVLPAVLIYRKKHNLRGAVIGLAVGIVTVVATMIFWNWFITPFYLHATQMAGMEVDFIREKIAVPMLMPIFLPFNLLKAILSSAIIMLIYKPLVSALRSANMLAGAGFKDAYKKENMLPNVLVIAASVVVIVVTLLVMLLVTSWK
jgi:riboflavin transporter FmnP